MNYSYSVKQLLYVPGWKSPRWEAVAQFRFLNDARAFIRYRAELMGASIQERECLFQIEKNDVSTNHSKIGA